MKLYLIYIKSDHIRDFKGVIVDMIQHVYGSDFALYAVTTSKKLLNEFIQNRDMNLFKIKEKEVSKEERDSIMSRFNPLWLDENTFMTKSIDDNGLVATQPIKVVSTCFEKDLINDNQEFYFFDRLNEMCEDDLIYNILVHTPFNNELKYSLSQILELEEFISEAYPKEDWKSDIFNFDELGSFVQEFGNTLK